MCVVLCQHVFAKLSPFTDCVLNYPVLHLESLIGFLMFYSVIRLFLRKADCHKYKCNNSISLVQSVGAQPAELVVCGLAFFGCHSNSSPLSYFSKLVRWAELLSPVHSLSLSLSYDGAIEEQWPVSLQSFLKFFQGAEEGAQRKFSFQVAVPALRF